MRVPSSTRLARALSIAAALVLPACGGGGGGGGDGGGGGTPAAFRVVALDPPNGATGVALHQPVTATFSLPVDPTSLGAKPIQVGIVGTGGVPGTCVLVDDGLGTSVTYTPSQAMDSDTAYLVIVGSYLRATTGEPLGGTTWFQFRTTGGVDIPLPSQLRPAYGSLNIGRRSHTATRLQNGRVLVCGGYEQGTRVTDRAEIYDPYSETFRLLTGRMTTPRAQHTATLLSDGRVLLVGGFDEVASGQLGSQSSAEVFDPASETFSSVGGLGIERVDHAALKLPDGRVLVTGGSRLLGGFLEDHASAEVFDPSTDTWSDWPVSMTHTRATHGMVDLMDGRFLLAGGSDQDLRCETFDTSLGTFSPLTAPPQDAARYGAAVATFGSGNASIVGGDNVGSVLFFDRASDLVLNTGSGTNRPRAYGTATRVGLGQILVVGGIDWSSGSMVLATVDFVVEGGVAGSQTYATTVRFPTGMANHTATVLTNGTVLFCGGLNPSGGQAELKGAYLFTP